MTCAPRCAAVVGHACSRPTSYLLSRAKKKARRRVCPVRCASRNAGREAAHAKPSALTLAGTVKSFQKLDPFCAPSRCSLALRMPEVTDDLSTTTLAVTCPCGLLTHCLESSATSLIPLHKSPSLLRPAPVKPCVLSQFCLPSSTVPCSSRWTAARFFTTFPPVSNTHGVPLRSRAACHARVPCNCWTWHCPTQRKRWSSDVASTCWPL